MRTWLRIGTGCAIIAWVFFVLCQVVSGDFLPPAISLSQYGIGPHGWLFTVWMLSVGLGSVALYRGARPRARLSTILLAIGVAGTVVMAVVRTDADGLQHSWHARVHMAGAVAALIALPLGMNPVAPRLGRWWGRLCPGLTVCTALCLILLVVSAAGVDTTGRGAAASWAWWQAVAVVIEMILLAGWSIAARDRPEGGRRRIPVRRPSSGAVPESPRASL